MSNIWFLGKGEKAFLGEFEKRASSFWDYLCDMYGHPEMLELHVPAVGKKGRRQDAKNIKGYFRKSCKKKFS